MADVYQKLIEYALRLAAKKRYTVDEMEKKLAGMVKKKKIEVTDEPERVIARLIELKYLGDAQYVADYVAESMKYRSKGIRALRFNLYRKGISKAEIEKYFDNNEVDEMEMAKVALEKKLRRLKDEPPYKARQKLFSYLAGRGFAVDTIYKVLDSCYNPDVR